ncbi:hypothetical protein FEP35_05463 [Burkholderia multivorans]|nr:hypothetical protein [Burkholderia multivorans]
MRLEQIAPHRQRIDPRRSCHVVQKAFEEECRIGVADAAPEADRHRQVDHPMRNVFVLDLVWQVEQTFRRVAINTGRRHAEQALQFAGQDRLADTARRDGRHPAVLDTRLQPRDGLRAIEVVSDVAFARPDHLHRAPLGVDSDRHGLSHKVRFEPPPEAAADQRNIDMYLIAAHACRTSRDQLGQRGHLRRRPKLHAILGHLRRAVDWLHGGMRKIRRAVFGLHDGRTLRLLEGLQTMARGAIGKAVLVAVQRSDELLTDASRIERGIRSVVPYGLERRECLSCLPVMIGHHGDARRAARRAIERHDMPHAGHGKRRFRLERLELAAEYRTHDHGRVHHAGRPRVDRKTGAAVRLAGDVVAWRRLADQPVLRSRLERDIGWRRNLARLSRNGAERHLLTVGANQLAFAHRDLRRLHAPFARGRFHQRSARRRGGLAHGLPAVGHAAAAAGDDQADLACALGHDPVQCARPDPGCVVRMQRQRAIAHGDDVTVETLDRRRLDTHALKRNIELLGGQHRQRRVDALPHLDTRHGKDHIAFRRDLDPAIQRDLT